MKKLAVALAALAVTFGGAFLVGDNFPTGGKVAIGFMVGFWLTAVAVITYATRRRAPALTRWVLVPQLVLAVAIGAVGFYVGRETTVHEDVVTGVPINMAETLPAPAPKQAPTKKQNIQLSSAELDGVSGHSGSGNAAVVELPDGRRKLTFTNFDSDPGAGNVRIYLVADNPTSDDDVDDFVDIAGRKGSNGDQQYDIPRDVDLERYDTVVVWCVTFSTRLLQGELH